MANIIKLNSKIGNNPILVNIDKVNVIMMDKDGGGSRICFKNSTIDELVNQTVEEIYKVIDKTGKKSIIKG